LLLESWVPWTRASSVRLLSTGYLKCHRGLRHTLSVEAGTLEGAAQMQSQQVIARECRPDAASLSQEQVAESHSWCGASVGGKDYYQAERTATRNL
jgi:hypothetical protein